MNELVRSIILTFNIQDVYITDENGDRHHYRCDVEKKKLVRISASDLDDAPLEK